MPDTMQPNTTPNQNIFMPLRYNKKAPKGQQSYARWSMAIYTHNLGKSQENEP